MTPDFNPYASSPVYLAPPETRADFVRKTYWHLAGAIGSFICLESVLLSIVPERAVFELLDVSQYSWLFVMLAFMLVSSLATRWASSGSAESTQYAGLGLYVLAEGVIFLPLLMMANRVGDQVIAKAAFVTLGMVLGLTTIAFTTKKDFSFLGGIVKIGCWVAVALIVASYFIPGMREGMSLWLCIGVVVLMSASILNQTSRIMYHYAPGQHVAASLLLFSSIATLFWYVLRLFMRRN